MNTISEAIKKSRKEKGWTQAQLGEALGISQQTVAQFENKRPPRKLETLERIADALDIHIFDLIRGDDKLKKEYLKAIFPPLTMEINIESGEDTLISNYQRLNHTGKEEAQKRVSELTEITRYTEEEK